MRYFISDMKLMIFRNIVVVWFLQLTQKHEYE